MKPNNGEKGKEMTRQKGESRVVEFNDNLVWNRNDCERFYLQSALNELNGKPLLLKFKMRDGQTYGGELVELGVYSYVVKLKYKDGEKLVILSKHAVDMVIIGDATP